MKGRHAPSTDDGRLAVIGERERESTHGSKE
ncbi:hypothetical protein predicted by Glimmer/Critica (plasmid) [Sinorhizobium fredii HH103]|uniref:Uncharacterized protein n=1 Tax=Sinorhizobium fredii (strain HH103) TaxID=1117943 RepID=G9AIP7_SINF1|nr:hypothetical protein predicted by Glimmer/Critica [Sinorhizobium fredii HH103]